MSVSPEDDKAELYTSHFESTKWIGLAFVLSSRVLLDDSIIPDSTVRAIVNKGLLRVLDLYFELRRRAFGSMDVEKLKNCILPNTLTSLQNVYLQLQVMKNSERIFQGIKLHVLMHMPELILRFGAPINWDTDHFESAHKDMVKQLYKRSSKRVDRIETELLEQVVLTSCYLLSNVTLSAF